MPQSRDTDESRSDADRALLVDLLYGELAAPDVADAEERLGGNDELQGEFAAFGRIRSMMSALPDEEPPAAISAKLLHAAAQQAASAQPAAPASADREGDGLWAWLTRLFRPLVMHPGLAAATSLVLVAGVAGALYVSGRVDSAQSPRLNAESSTSSAGDVRAAESSQAPGASAAPSAPMMSELPREEPAKEADSTGDQDTPGISDRDAPADKVSGRRNDRRAQFAPETGESRRRARIDGLDGDLEGDLGNVKGTYKSGLGGSAGDGDGDGDGAGASGTASPARSAGPRSKKRPQKQSRRSSNRPTSKGAAQGMIDIGLEEPTLAPVPDSPAPEASPAAPNAKPEPAEGAVDEEAEDKAEREKAADRAPGKKRKERRTRGASKGGASKGGASKSDASKSDAPKNDAPATTSRSRARSLHDEARDAARSGDCGSVRSIGRRIQKLDRQYYLEQFRRDKVLTRCLGKKR